MTQFHTVNSTKTALMRGSLASVLVLALWACSTSEKTAEQTGNDEIVVTASKGGPQDRVNQPSEPILNAPQPVAPAPAPPPPAITRPVTPTPSRPSNNASIQSAPQLQGAVPKSTVSRLFATVERKEGYAEDGFTRKADGTYDIGDGLNLEIIAPEYDNDQTLRNSSRPRVETKPERFIIRNDEGRIIREFASRNEFEKFQSNPYKRVSDNPVSTFSADVDTASYSFTRQYVKRGQTPPKHSVRVEEMINYFDYDYDVPNSRSAPFKPNISIVPSPWNSQTKLVHIGIKGYDIPARKRPPMNLVFLVDISGSMKDENKLPLLKRSFEQLVKNLNADDKVSIVTYGPTVETILIPTRGDKTSKILEAIAPLQAQGGTAGEAGLQTAYRVAEQAFNDEGTNRVILATDGDFNIGISDPEDLKTFIEDKREKDIYLSVLGFGQGNVKDNRMQAMAQNGNGTAGYIDSLREARKFFDVDMGKNLFPIADDVKIQVEFNPELVDEYRLIGYETRALARQDFNNDKVDAGDIGAGHTVTAIYEITPAGSEAPFVDPLRYGTAPQKPKRRKTAFGNEYGFVKLRYKLPGEDTSKLITASIQTDDEYRNINRAPKSTRWATAVSAYGLKLRGDGFMGDLAWDEVTRMAENAKGRDRYGYQAEFIDLTRDAASVRTNQLR